jgi:hypothetical protein
MMINLGKRVLQWRWLIAVMIGLILMTYEVAEHRPSKLTEVDGDFAREVVAFGIAFPLVTGAALGKVGRRAPHQSRAAINLTEDGRNGATAVRRVFVIDNTTLLGAGISSLLTHEPDLHVSGMTPEDDAAVLEELDRFEPDVVVLDEATTDANRLCGLLRGVPQLRVVVVSADDDVVQVYEQRRVTVTKAAELMAFFRS